MEDKDIWNGPCVGGPIDGQDGASRFPRGFLLVDRPANKVWIYDYVAEPTPQFVCRVAEGADLQSDPAADKNRFRAAEELEFDLVAAPWIDAPAADAEEGE